MSGKSDINKEGSRLGVHAADKHNVLNSLLNGKICSIVVSSIIDELTHESNRLLSEVLINLRHVKIIYKVDKSLSSRRSK
jgi:hypothetical protein